MNNQLAKKVIEEALYKGIREFCVCPGSRNSPLVYALMKMVNLPFIRIYSCFEERSMAFFALGRIKAIHQPVAVLTTSGTAAGELLPATMEAYYTSLPLLLITADRPRRFRGTGAPQSAEQVGLFGGYVHFSRDIAFNESWDLEEWGCRGPAHLNVCLEEPKDTDCQSIQMHDILIKDLIHRSQSHVIKQEHFALPVSNALPFTHRPSLSLKEGLNKFQEFIRKVHYPLVVVGSLSPKIREFIIQFLIQLQAPIYAEGISNIREEKRLAHLRISNLHRIWQVSEEEGYPIDGILRLGSVPTARLWRDLEEKQNQLEICSVSEYPFSGLTWDQVICTSLVSFCTQATEIIKSYDYNSSKQWINQNQDHYQRLLQFFEEEPEAEPSLVHHLSKIIPSGSRVYLGNSLPIREWDLGATYENRHYTIEANRGMNGIDGQISTFLGFSADHPSNWAILGDLTTLYDMAGGGSIFTHLSHVPANLVVINNRGGQIFSQLYTHPIFLQEHQFEFKHLAAFYGLQYEKWNKIPPTPYLHQRRLIEVIPEPQATKRFWEYLITEQAGVPTYLGR
jgi:2-succinyl-5-enolpyruvyl-6-hydroxy-3-cyclohexene-1-carboxylate synthase